MAPGAGAAAPLPPGWSVPPGRCPGRRSSSWRMSTDAAGSFRIISRISATTPQCRHGQEARDVLEHERVARCCSTSCSTRRRLRLRPPRLDPSAPSGPAGDSCSPQPRSTQPRSAARRAGRQLLLREGQRADGAHLIGPAGEAGRARHGRPGTYRFGRLEFIQPGERAMANAA